MNIVRIKLRWDPSDEEEAPYDDVDLDALSPRARTLAEAVAGAPLQTAADIWMEHEKPQREVDPDWEFWLTEEEADRPARRSWRGWERYPANSQTTPVEYLERQARKIPPSWHVLGHHPLNPVPSLEAGAADQGMTRDMVLSYLRDQGRNIAVSTWSSYVARDQAPKPARYVQRTPLWDRADIDAWLQR